MPQKHTFSVLPLLRRSRLNKQGEAPIYVRITVDGKPAEISTKHYIDPELWMSEKGRVKGSKENARMINTMLDGIRIKLNKIHNKLEDEEELITSERIKNIYLGKSSNRKTLLEVFRYHNAQMKVQVGKEFSAGTYERYQTTLRLIEEFIQYQYKKDDLYLSELKFSFITELEYYFKTVRNCAHNTTMKYITNIRKVVNIAVKNEWLEKDPFLKFKVALKEVKRDFLTQEELDRLEARVFNIERLNVVKDIFVFCCYTGLAYADIKKLTPNDITRGVDGEMWIFTDRTKTGSSSNVPLLPPALALIEKYKNHPKAVSSGCIFPVSSNQKMNAYLKEVEDLCGISKSLTMHIARHTFATTVTLTNGVPIESVSKMLGHKNLRTTQMYAKVVEQKVSEDMRVLKEKMMNKQTQYRKAAGS